jgi:hypothetical protein
MTKFLIAALFTLMISAEVQAFDSVAFFGPGQTGKLGILINEIGNGKLAQLFGVFGSQASNEFDWSTNGQSNSDVILRCNRGANMDPAVTPYSCTFTFSSSAGVQISTHAMSASVGLVNSSPLLNLLFVNESNQSFNFQYMTQGLIANATLN